MPGQINGKKTSESWNCMWFSWFSIMRFIWFAILRYKGLRKKNDERYGWINEVDSWHP